MHPARAAELVSIGLIAIANVARQVAIAADREWPLHRDGLPTQNGSAAVTRLAQPRGLASASALQFLKWADGSFIVRGFETEALALQCRSRFSCMKELPDRVTDEAVVLLLRWHTIASVSPLLLICGFQAFSFLRSSCGHAEGARAPVAVVPKIRRAGRSAPPRRP